MLQLEWIFFIASAGASNREHIKSFSVISQLRRHIVQRLDNDDMILWRVDNGYNGHSMIDSIIVHNSYCQWSHKLHKYTISMVKSMFHKLSGNQLMENITQ